MTARYTTTLPTIRREPRYRQKLPNHINNCDGTLHPHVAWDKATAMFYALLRCSCSAVKQKSKKGRERHADAHDDSLKMEKK